jgi:hypothetical protein
MLDYSKANCKSLFASNICDNLKFHWKLFTNEIIKYLFPSISRILGFPVEDGQGFNYCPPKLLECLISFIRKITTIPLIFGETMPQKEMSFGLLQELLLNQESNREIVHEIIRQSMMHKTYKNATFIITTWIMSSAVEQPEFISRSIQPSTSPSLDTSPQTSMSIFPKFLRRYLKYLRLSVLNSIMEDEIQVISSNSVSSTLFISFISKGYGIRGKLFHGYV